MKRYSCIAEADAEFRQTAKDGKIITAEMARAAYTNGGSMPKDLAMMYWAHIPEKQEIIPHFHALPPKSSGSTYGACGIRIDGTPEFVDAVLSRLKDLLDLENGATRLGFSRSKVKATKIAGDVKTFDNAARDSECCYIRLHERGVEAQMAHAMCGVGGLPKKPTRPERYDFGLQREPCRHTGSIFGD